MQPNLTTTLSRYTKRETIKLYNPTDGSTLDATVVDRRSFGIHRFILPEMSVRVSGSDSYSAGILQLRVYDRTMITNRQRFNRWNERLERAYSSYIKSREVEHRINDRALLRELERAVNEMHNHPVDADWPVCQYSEVEREVYFHAAIRDAFFSTQDYYKRLESVLGNGQGSPRIHGYYTIKLDESDDDLTHAHAILMEDTNSVYRRSNDQLFDKLPQSVYDDVAESMYVILEKLEEAQHINTHLSLQAFKYRESEKGYEVMIDDPKYGRFRDGESDEEWRRAKRMADEHNQMSLQILCEYEERGLQYTFKPSQKYRRNGYKIRDREVEPVLYAHYLNELGPNFERYRRDRGYTLECPYAVGDIVTLALDEVFSENVGSGVVDVEVLKLFQPITVSPVMLVRLRDNDAYETPMVLKLFDRRCTPTGRYVSKDDNGTEDWNEEIEADYVEFVESGQVASFNSVSYSQRHLAGEPRSYACDEEVLRNNVNEFFRSELNAYKALQPMQQNGSIPKVFASIKHPSHLTGKEVQKYFNIPGLLMEYIPGPKLDKMFDSVPKEHWEKLAHHATHILHSMFEHGVMNVDARPDQVIVRCIDQHTYKPTMIDFGECVIRNHCASEQMYLSQNRWDIENNINKLMHERFKEVGVDYLFDLTHKYARNGCVLNIF